MPEPQSLTMSEDLQQASPAAVAAENARLRRALEQARDLLRRCNARLPTSGSEETARLWSDMDAFFALTQEDDHGR